MHERYRDYLESRKKKKAENASIYHQKINKKYIIENITLHSFSQDAQLSLMIYFMEPKWLSILS